MKENTTKRLPGRCPHCGGTFTVDEDVNKCLACSRTIQGDASMRAYYDYNQDAILADFGRLGRAGARVKWGIRSSSMHYLLKRFVAAGAPAPKERKKRVVKLRPAEKESAAAAPAPDPDPPGEAGPFGLPVWSDSWDVEVKLRWLDVFGEVGKLSLERRSSIECKY